MTKRIYDVSAVTLDAEGRPVLSDDVLLQLEDESIVMSFAGGSDIQKGINWNNCNGSTNSGQQCTNGSCAGTTNLDDCRNTQACATNTNDFVCVNSNPNCRNNRLL